MGDPRLVRALLFDFNGTLSDDEAIQCEIYQALFAEQGRPLSVDEYYEQLAGLSDPEIVAHWLGPGHPAAEKVLAGRIRLFRERVADGSTVPPHVREAVLHAANRVKLAVVSGAARYEVETVLRGAGIDVFDAIVAAEDVKRGKPDPEGYLRALELLGEPAGSSAAIEDSEPGVEAAKAAGVYCVAVLGTVPAERLALADEIAPRLDAELVQRLLG
jgi:beta-phosphoglucomutase